MNYIVSLPSLSTVVNLEGYNFNYTQYVVLSSNQTALLPSVTAFDLFSTFPKISATNPAFSGYPITTYNIISKNIMNITAKLSGNAQPSLFDVIIVDAAGYTKLSDKGYLLSGGNF